MVLSAPLCRPHRPGCLAGPRPLYLRHGLRAWSRPDAIQQKIKGKALRGKPADHRRTSLSAQYRHRNGLSAAHLGTADGALAAGSIPHDRSRQYARAPLLHRDPDRADRADLATASCPMPIRSGYRAISAQRSSCRSTAQSMKSCRSGRSTAMRRLPPSTPSFPAAMPRRTRIWRESGFRARPRAAGPRSDEYAALFGCSIG